MSVCGLGYMAVNVVDMDGWLDIMTSVLGTELRPRDEGGVIDIRLDDWHHRLTLYPSDTDSIAVVGWELPNEAALEAMVTALRDYGV
jgi:hypothetical protein